MAFAQLSDLEDRLEWDLDENEKRVAQAALDDLSVEARHLGQDWPDTACPPYVRKVVLSAAVRYMRNLEGVVQSRAGDETLIWAEDKDGGAGSARFNKGEIDGIIGLALGPAGFGTIEVVAWGNTPRTRTGYVPAGGGDLVPFFAEGDV